MQGIWSQVVTITVIVQIALVSGKAIQQNQQTQQELEQKSPNDNAAQKRVGYDYPAPPSTLINPYQDDLHLNDHLHHEVTEHHDHHDDHHDHHDHHDPGYWKKKLIWKSGWKKIWRQAKKQYWKPTWHQVWKQSWVRDYKQIWVPGVKKIWRPVWISEWFPSPDHHEHVHESHGWDRSDNSTAVSQKSSAAKTASQEETPDQTQQGAWQFPK